MIKLISKLVLASLILSATMSTAALANDEIPAVPAVIGISTAHQENGEPVAGLGDTITLSVQNLDTLLKKAEQENHQIILYLNDMPIRGAHPNIGSNNESLSFLLERTKDSKDVWNLLLGKPDSFNRKVYLSVGFEDGYTITTGIKEFNLVIISSKIKFAFWVVCIIAIFILFCYLGIKTPILRTGGQQTPYSLARTQMLAWTFIVIIAYLFIWIVIRDFNSVNTSVLILLGISGGTALGAVLVDDNKSKKYAELVAQRDALRNIVDETQQSLPNLSQDRQEKAQNDNNDKKIRLGILEQKIIDFPIPDEENMVSSGFFNDILSDSDGYSIHRLQMFIWTIILIGIFINCVYVNLSMPEFNTTLLALMGISSGTYIGFKFPEK